MKRLILGFSLCLSFGAAAAGAEEATPTTEPSAQVCVDPTAVVSALAARCCPYLDPTSEMGTSRGKVKKCIKDAIKGLKAVRELVPGGEQAVPSYTAGLKDLMTQCFDAFPEGRDKNKKKNKKKKKKKKKSKKKQSSDDNSSSDESSQTDGLTCDQCVNGCLEVGAAQGFPVTEAICQSQCAAGNDQFGIPAGTC